MKFSDPKTWQSTDHVPVVLTPEDVFSAECRAEGISGRFATSGIVTRRFGFPRKNFWECCTEHVCKWSKDCNVERLETVAATWQKAQDVYHVLFRKMAAASVE